MTAVEASARLRNERLLGYEVIIPRSVLACEVMAIRSLPHIGWRFFPAAKGNPPLCQCRFCNRGEIKNKRMRDRLDPAGEYN